MGFLQSRRVLTVTTAIQVGFNITQWITAFAAISIAEKFGNTGSPKYTYIAGFNLLVVIALIVFDYNIRKAGNDATALIVIAAIVNCVFMIMWIFAAPLSALVTGGGEGSV